MASGIQNYLNSIINAIYGRDVRNAIHDAIETCYDDVSSGKTIAEAAAANVNTAVDNATTAANAATAATANANEAATAANTAAENATEAASGASEAISSANTAASDANTAAASANTAATNANTAADAANSAAERAEEAMEAISEISVDTDAAITAVSRCNDATDAANTAASNANTAASAANTAASNADTKASAATTAANSCSSAATAANTAATNANTARDAANTAASDANTARDDANAAANSARSAANSATNAATNANSAATTANSKITAMDSKMFDCEAATSNANTAAGNANTAAGNANTAAAAIDNLTVDYEDVGPTVPASAELQTVNGHRNIHFLLRQGASGASFTIKGSAYPTVAALQEAVTNPEVGDQYNVGSEAPYNIYRWTGSSWEDQGTIGTNTDPFTTQDVQAIQNGREIEGGSTKVVKLEALTYLLNTLLANKVDRVQGKGLSTLDFTVSDKAAITNLTSSVETLSSSKVDKVNGKGLSTNDLTDSLLDKISLIGDDTLNTTAATIIAAINELVSGKANADIIGTGNLSTTAKTIIPAINELASGRQSRNLYFTNKEASSWTEQSTPTYAGYPYRCAIRLSGVTAAAYAEVIFAPEQALSGNYAPVCQTYGMTTSSGGVYIYSKVNTTITIPTIVVLRGA